MTAKEIQKKCALKPESEAAQVLSDGQTVDVL